MAVKKATCKDKAGAAGKKSKQKNATLIITNGCFAGLEMPINHTLTTLGRSLKCDICLDGSPIADEHAVIHKSKGTFILKDLKSSSGTRLNGEKIQQKILQSGDVIEIGDFRLQFTS